jgi:nucleoside-diphosphate-sugar epimerase
MWERALTSNVPALEIRASDYLGDGAGSLFTLMTLPPLLAGEPSTMPGDLDALHAWSFTKDVARTLVAASRYSGDWGRAFHVPSQHISVRDLAARLAELGGAPLPGLRALTDEDLEALAREDEFMREIPEMVYLFRQPCILDASDTERLLGVYASSLDVMIEDTLWNRGS